MKNLIPIIIKYILYPVLIIILLLNVLMLLRGLCHIIPGYEIIGNNSESNIFFSFWIDIFAVAASTGMIIVTAKSIKRNSQENENNRKLQIDAIEYQTKIEWVNKLKEGIAIYLESINDDVHIKFATEYKNIDNKEEINFIELINKLISEANQAKLKLGTLFIGIVDSKTTAFEIELQKYYDRYLDLLMDLQYFFSINKLWFREEFIESLLEYKNTQMKLSPNNNGPNRIWEIIEEFDYSKNNLNEYLQILMQRYNIQCFRVECVKYIQNEVLKANNILHGTEQDK